MHRITNINKNICLYDTMFALSKSNAIRSNLKNMRKITVAKGDGIGPEIMDATLAILFAVLLAFLYKKLTGQPVHVRSFEVRQEERVGNKMQLSA
jgi:hypothetical protein